MANETETKTILEKLTELVIAQQAQMTQLMAVQTQTPPPATPVTQNSEISATPISIKLDGTNYSIWSEVVSIHVKARHKMHHLTGDPPPPPTDHTTYPKWSADDSVVKSWLISSLDPTLLPTYLRYKTAGEMWRALATTYYDGNDESQVFDLNRQVSRLKHTGKLEDYYNGLQGLWREIDYRRPNPMTSAPDIEKFNEYLEKSRVYTFLDGLDDRLDNLRSQVLRITPFPTVEQAYGLVRREVSRQTVMLKGSEGTHQNSMAMYTKGASSVNYQDKSKLKCTSVEETGMCVTHALRLWATPTGSRERRGSYKEGLRQIWQPPARAAR